MDSFPLQLVELCHRVGDPQRGLCILSEGNVSLRPDSDSFWIKASGESLATLDETGLCQVQISSIMRAIGDLPSELALHRRALNNACQSGNNGQPSTETFMHALLYAMTSCRAIVHTHPIPVLSLLCTFECHLLATLRLFPDEVVLCGPATCFVPYAMPGLDLAKAIHERMDNFKQRHGRFAKTLWLQNHGLITLGDSSGEAEAATMMAVKSAQVLLGALQSGKEVHGLSPSEISAIANWPDEHYRQDKLWSNG